MHIALLNYPYLPDVTDPEVLLERFHALTGWAEALLMPNAECRMQNAGQGSEGWGVAGETYEVLETSQVCCHPPPTTPDDDGEPIRVTVLQRFPIDAELRRGAISYRFVRDGFGPLPRSWQIPRRLHRLAAELGPDVAHLHGQIFPLHCLDLRRRLPRTAALLVQHHAGGPPQADGLRGAAHLALARLGLRAADGFLFTSAAMAEPWRAAGIIGPRQAIYPVLEASTALRPPPAPTRLRGDPALLWVGRLHPVKDPLTVLEGFALARRSLPAAALTMVYGSEDLLPQVRARCAAPDLSGAVDLLGRLPYAELPEIYAGADIFVLGSRREGTCFALLEALACGLTPAVTRIAGFVALVGGGEKAEGKRETANGRRQTAEGRRQKAAAITQPAPPLPEAARTNAPQQDGMPGPAVGELWEPGDAAGCAAAIVRAAAGDREGRRAAARAHFARHLSWEAVGRAALEAYVAAAGVKRAV